MTNEKIDNLEWKIYKWMIEDLKLQSDELNLFAFIHEYSEQKEIANFAVMRQLFGEQKVKEILKVLLSKDLISEEYSPAIGKYYETNLIQEKE